jgi:hypothetical protein
VEDRAVGERAEPSGIPSHGLSVAVGPGYGIK